MSLARNVEFVDLEPAPLHKLGIMLIRNDERELKWRYVLMQHSSPSLLVGQIGTVDSVMERTMKYVGLLDVPHMGTEEDHH